ncbi:DUF4091 domain-containing protein [Paenibacillus dakarensis]|uniref:DUF4091 domain-containing protein n=1 Tax=Paenibacillus dakarensis TaxID=1527293 RepID=UPI0006D55725|nr:DUF4091 domain-containing protein [Paenibacillus dakarensis]
MRNKLFLFLLSVLLLTSFLPSNAEANTEAMFDVWVPTNTEKVLRNQPFPEPANAVIRLGAARNEYESAQLIVKAGNQPLQKLQISMSELKQKDGSAKISKDDIQLFRQHYVEVTVSTTAAYPKGWYPDALIPLDGTLDVAAGNNQGIWIKVHIPKGQPAGTYTGEVMLHELGNPVRVTVELTVWDFELTDESHAKTNFGVWGGPVQEHHGNVVGEEAWKYIEKYYMASVEHRLTPGFLPIPDTDIESYVERAPKYINDPRISAYRLPYYRTADGEPDIERIRQLVDRLREKDLLSKAYFYVSEIDEPTRDKYDRVKQIDHALEEAAPGVPHLVTIQPVDELTGDVDIWVPDIEKFDPVFAKEQQAAGDSVWWYTYVKPKHPYPSYHVDDDLVGTRLLTWMQRDNGVEGTLYWATTQFGKYDYALKKYIPRDVWKDPLAFPGANGDGYLFYPGTEVGVDGPIGTIRLEVLRESMEDYEYLWMYEQGLRKAAAQLGIENEFPYREAVRPFYDRLYENIKTFDEDPSKVMQVRTEIAEEIAAQADSVPVLVTVDTPKDGARNVTVYTEKGSEVTINGQQMPAVEQGEQHTRFSTELALEAGVHELDIAVSRDGKTTVVKRQLVVYETDAPHSIVLNDAETPEAVKRFTSSTVKTGLSEQHVTEGTYSMEAIYPANVNFPNLRLFEAGKGFRSSDWSAFETLEFDVFNPGETVQFYVKFHQLDGKSDDTFIQTVRAGQDKKVVIPLRQVNLDMTKIKGIELWMWRQSAPQTLYFDNFRFTSAAPQEPMIPGGN